MQRTPRLFSPILSHRIASSVNNLNIATRIDACTSCIASHRMASTAAAKTPVTGATKTPYSRYKSTPIPTNGGPLKRAAKTGTTPSINAASQSADSQASNDPASAVAQLSDSSFPVPQPAALLPDYAALAPSRDLSAPASRKSTTQTMHLAESPGFDTGPTAAAGETISWETSFHGLSAKPYEREVAQILMRPLGVKDIEIKPDGLLYLPEIKYRRTLNEAFGPGGWGLAPRGETTITERLVSREWGLVCLGRLASVARGEQEYFNPDGVPTAIEASKSNALMRCCKDLGIASELWDPTFIKDFKKKHCVDVMVEHVTSKKKRKLWRKKEDKFEYPYKEL
ncbi:hypothetical protein QFC22_000406 [Naganishia vaughanmartiniae]|uniref:Uncharacterized protein n=1 Tax=Naganishia vaughanmartiniae TaxID=1424756 RepID=A0ACC2XQ09_9TREE|nr:hypothetical protein QFC22_000406 [Naganishia vaughanmartiniae]